MTEPLKITSSSSLGPAKVALCPSCGAPVTEADLDPALDAGKCTNCWTVFSLAHTTGDNAKDEVPGATTKGTTREKMDLPARFRLEPTRDALAVSFGDNPIVGILLLLFVVPWFGSMAVLMAFLFFAEGGSAVLLALLTVPNVLIAVVVSYFGFRVFANRTRIFADRSELKVTVGPLPPTTKHRFPAAEVDQLFCIPHRHVNKSGSVRRSYTVMLRTKSGRDVELIQDLWEGRHALYLEQEIERRLRIVDRPMPGELPRAP
jgi:hypothetical protein